MSKVLLQRIAGSQSRGAVMLVGAAALVGLLTSPGVRTEPDAQATPPLRSKVAEASELARTDPEQAIARLQEVRREAMAAKDLHTRLAADEAECIVGVDVDPKAAQRVAEAGLAVADSAAGGQDLQQAVLRLRVCRAGILAAGSEHEAGMAELEAVLALATTPAMASVRALALLDRGVARTRDGSAVAEGQSDLMTACRMFDQLGMAPERDDCLWFLAQHELNAGDVAEAARVTKQLLDRARARGAVSDQNLYVMGLGQAHEASGDLEVALADYTEGLRLAEQLGDPTSIIFGLHQLGQVSLALDRPAQAMTYLDLAWRTKGFNTHPESVVRLTILRGHALTKLRRSSEAVAQLAGIERSVNELANPMVRQEWLNAQRLALAASNQWRAAYALLEERTRIFENFEEQARSEQSARMRSQFNRDRDMAEVESLQRLNAQGQRLRQAQGAALALFVLVLIGTAAFAWTKWRQSRRLQTLALTDELTGLPNRRAVMAWAGERFEQARRLGKPMAVLIVDADRFKLVNDQHGHAVGDEVLRELSRRLPDAMRRGRDRLGRMGGEEFLGVLPDTSAEQAAAIAQRMRESICASPFETSVGLLVVTVSIGLALRDPEAAYADESLAALSQRADEALYAAKAGGRNQVVLAPTAVPPNEAEPQPQRSKAPIVLRTRPADLRLG